MGGFSEAQLLAELARRRMPGGRPDLDALEEVALGVGAAASEELLEATIAALPPEGSEPQPCPKCGKPVPVKAHNRVRRILTTAGELRLSRNYHYCRRCRVGFAPRDRELNLPEDGEVSGAMERRILDFGVNDTFASSAQRWRIHYPSSISENLVRRVVERVGRRCEAAHSEVTLQHACRPPPEQPPRVLVVAADGSMLLTREYGWREAKVAVVARGERILEAKQRRTVDDARYVAVLDGQPAFRAALAAALEAESADEAPLTVWLGDGAKENWTLASDLCPFAIQVLDLPHAVQNAMDCAKALLGEADPCLPLWEARIRQLLHADSPDAAIRELLDCLELTTTDDELAALDRLIGYYRSNDKRMRYTEFREQGLPIGSGIVESAHRHVLQVRMKRAGQRWALPRARRMVRLRAAYRTAGPMRFHAAIREALRAPAPRSHTGPLPNGPRRAKHRYHPSRVSPFNRGAASI